MAKLRQEFQAEPNTVYKIVCADNESLGLTMSKSVGRYCKPMLSIFANLQTQKFVIVPTQTKKLYRMFTMHNNEAICMKPIKFCNGQYLKFSTFTNTDAENWLFENISQASGTRYKIKSISDHYLDLRNQMIQEGNQIMIWSKTKSLTQIWKIVPL